MKECGLESGEQLAPISCLQPWWEETELTLKRTPLQWRLRDTIFSSLWGVFTSPCRPKLFPWFTEEYVWWHPLSRIFMNILHLYNTKANISFDLFGKPKHGIISPHHRQGNSEVACLGSQWTKLASPGFPPSTVDTQVPDVSRSGHHRGRSTWTDWCLRIPPRPMSCILLDVPSLFCDSEPTWSPCRIKLEWQNRSLNI